MPIRKSLILICLTCAPVAALAQDVSELDRLSQASTDVGPGVALARSQIGEGDLIGAAATLERVLMVHPEADGALLLHATLLCRLDDPQGASTELAELAGRPILNRAWAEVTAACGAMPRPGGRGGR